MSGLAKNPFGSCPIDGAALKTMFLLHGEVATLGFDLIWSGTIDSYGEGKARHANFYVQPNQHLVTYAEVSVEFATNGCRIRVLDPKDERPTTTPLSGGAVLKRSEFRQEVLFGDPASTFAAVVAEVKRVVQKNASLLEGIASASS